MTYVEAIATPAGLQDRTAVTRRRVVAAVANVAIYVALCGWLAAILAVGGWSMIDLAFFACFLVASPWAILGFVNAALGLWLARFAPGGVAAAAPYLTAGDRLTPVNERIAVVMTVRNEDAARAIGRLERMELDLAAHPDAECFSWRLLSDTSAPEIAADEDRLIAQWRAQRPEAAARIACRRRIDNTGFKAGNLIDFCAHDGDDHDFMLVLDADSYMSADTILRMARICGAHPRIGILQSLVVGAPSRSAFARLFQFGMRLGMRSYTLGASWWMADCGPFWGHNALVRIAPFREHCKLPIVPGGPILSHDQIEAALMRRAGYEVRVMPVESESFEENPPDMAEFSRRDLRWCRGNMQYWRLLGLPGLAPASRFQLVWAIAMFLGLPASQALLLLGALKPFDSEPAAAFPAGSALAFLFVYLLIGLAPKLAGLADVAIGGLARYGGARKFGVSAALELAASYLCSAAIGFRTSTYLVGLPFHRAGGWGAQRRDAGALSWRAAARDFWSATLFGLVVLALLAAGAPSAIPVALPFVAGLVLAIPFAVVTASPKLGAFFVAHTLCATPEELTADAD